MALREIGHPQTYSAIRGLMKYILADVGSLYSSSMGFQLRPGPDVSLVQQHRKTWERMYLNSVAQHII